ncbi:MAG TPA: DinB family protein [Bryobacteraceae bacterium]|nr:DinB family protein [Bryobacteraceae bacterium]
MESTEKLPEPWLRGSIAGVPVMVAPILYAFQQAREDLAKYTAGLTDEQIWATPHGFGSVGFHLRHIAGSTERLMTYLQGRQLSETQMAALQEEKKPGGPGRDELLARLDRAFRDAEAIVRTIDPAALAEPRSVGRKQLPTTVIGLLTHIAEHTQRHVGQGISAAKLAAVL